MPDCWVERPRVYPYKCAVSARSSAEDGPYYEFPFEYQMEDDGPISRLYIAAKYLRMPFTKSDAPYAIVDEAMHEAILSELQDADARIEELEAEVGVLSASLEAERDIFARARVKNAAPTTTRKRPAAKPA